MAEITAGEFSVERTMFDLRMLYGGESEKADPKKWVFVPEGVKAGQGANFFDEYSEAIRGVRKEMPGLPGRRLYFDTNFENEPRSGKEAEGLFFDYFNTVSEYFSHPANIGKLGLMTRQFLSHYVDEDLLRDVEPKICQKLEEMEDEVVQACPGNRASMTDLLRMLYNRSLSNALTEDDAVEIRAGKFGTQGKSLTLIDMPEDLLAKRRMEEMQMSRRGKIYCLGDDDGDVYQRGGWSDKEWEEAKSRIEMELGGNPLSKATRLKAVDQFYFPQKLSHSVGSCYNLIKTLRNTVISQCKERREFSIVRFVSVLKEQREGQVGGGQSPEQREYPAAQDYDYDPGHMDHEEEMPQGDGRGMRSLQGGEGDAELLPDEEELDAPVKRALLGGENRPDSPSQEAEGKEATSSTEKSPSDTKKPRETKTPQQKAMGAFVRKWGIQGSRETGTLESIFSRKEGFSPSDYAPEINAFCKTEALLKGTGVDQWIEQGQRARGIDEAKVLALKSLPCKAVGKVALVVEKDGGETAVLLAKRSEGEGAVLFKEVDPQELERVGKMRNGKLFIEGGEGGFRPISGIIRVPYQVPVKAGITEEKDQPLRKGGILSFFRRFGRGDNVK